MNEIEERWKTYRLRVIPLDAPELQAIEGRRAFYAGAQTVLDLMLRSTAQGQVQAVREIKALKADVEDFRALVRADKA
jgi:hypothetical protein